MVLSFPHHDAYRLLATRNIAAVVMQLREQAVGLSPEECSALNAEVMVTLATISAFHAKGKPAFTLQKCQAAHDAALGAIETVCDEFDHRN